jgi:bifunctional non-homologous end joining protein LigD
MVLENYNKKRNFAKTAEPEGKTGRSEGGDSFVIQKHDATRLHYDFRLEVDGVLKSWAVTRGPSLVAGEKRLAVHVEDHPLDYGDFEGTIPKGEYGGGTVIVWDRGRWAPVHDWERGYAKGHIELELMGEKLQGRWHLVRLPPKPREKRENWLLIKSDDEAARAASDPDILVERPESVKTGRLIEAVAGEEPGWSSKTGKIDRQAEPEPAQVPDAAKVKGAKKAKLPTFEEPALATLVTKVPAGSRWIHEIKFDGYRLQARIEGGRVKLLTRTGLDWTARFGKAVTQANGASDFSALQADLSQGRSDRFTFYAFDLLHLDGFDLTEVPLITRKEVLEQLLAGADSEVRYSAHFEQNGATILQHACRLSLEGVVSKLRDAPYRGGRGKSWVKSKCSKRQEFVVAGYVPSTTSRKAIGSLVMGYYDGDRLIHVGRVGTGYTGAVAEDLFTRLEKLRIDTSPFAEKLVAEAARGVRYEKPELVAEVEFRAWTADDNIRHASFRGLREDKAATEIVREGEAPVAAPKPRSSVTLTHPDRLYWPDVGVTKGGLADYYSDVWRRIAPFIVARPLSLLRCPGGTTAACFFQKHAWKGLSKSIKLVKDPKDSDDDMILTIDSLDGLIGLVQGAVLEIHPWGSSLAALECPDMIIMDLDPGPGVTWNDVIVAAREIQQRLDGDGLTSFVKTSGGKGLHVVAPLDASSDWDTVKAYTKALADAMASDSPDRYVSTVSKAKRQGKILIDYLRNGRGATAVASYSTRARPGAAVSMPLGWDELDVGLGPDYFTVMNTSSRLANLAADPWDGFRSTAAPLPGKSKRKS